MSRVLLLLGAGPNIGAATAEAFRSVGYKVALVSRTANNKGANTPEELYLAADLWNSSCIPGVFETVTEKLGVPNVVIYNAGAISPTEQYETSLDFLLSSMNSSLAAFSTLPQSTPKTFICTGNSSYLSRPGLGTRGSTIEEAMKEMIEIGANTHGKRNIAGSIGGKDIVSFYYVNERTDEGGSVLDKGGPSAKWHASMFLELSKREEQGEWNLTFVEGVGHWSFD